MEENTAMENVNDNGGSLSTSSDSLFLVIAKTVLMMLIGGLIVKGVKRLCGYFRENKRLREAEKQKKEQERFDKLVDQRAAEMFSDYLAKQAEESEKASEKE